MFPFRQSIVFQQAQLPVIFTVDQCSFFFLRFNFDEIPEQNTLTTSKFFDYGTPHKVS